MILVGIIVFYALPALIMTEVARCLALELRGDRIPILLYHRLISRPDVAAGRISDTEPIYACYEDAFADQMDHLVAEGYATLSLDDLLAIRRGTMPRPRRPIVITFDDGYASNHALAWPVLRRHRLRATIFVAPEPDAHTRGFVAGVDGFLTRDQMREMDHGGIAIESHTLTHCVLSDLDDAAARHELKESRRVLGEIVGRPIRHLAVPRSGHGWRIRRLAREEGYQTVCSNGKGTSNGWSSLFALPRIVVERDMSLEDFARALSPRGAVFLRLVGTLKRAPRLLLGPDALMAIRGALLSGPLGVLLQTRRLVRVLTACACLYALATALFTWYLVSR